MRIVTQSTLHALFALLSEFMFASARMNSENDDRHPLSVDLIALSGFPALVCTSHDKERCVWIVKEQGSSNYVLWFGESTFVSRVSNSPQLMHDTSSIFMQAHSCVEAVKTFIQNGTLPENVLPAGHFANVAGRAAC
jgi:hypothetical protein